MVINTKFPKTKQLFIFLGRESTTWWCFRHSHPSS